ncbi:MAG: FtsX-like permease family protein [Hyphomicrobiales bacterium]
MHAIDRKLLRDFRRLWAQALAIAIVLACGVAILITSFGMYRALDETRDAYYERNRFADVFANARRAPMRLVRQIEEISGVQAVEARVTGTVILDLPDRIETAVGSILSLPEIGQPRLNVPLLRTGRLPTATGEIAVNEPFALANGFALGDQFDANLNGRKQTLTITGTLLSPEFIYTLGPGALMPNNRTFGILWMPRGSAEAAFDMVGAFSEISLAVDSRTQLAPVLDALDGLLDPYGGLGAIERKDQLSNAFIDAEIAQLRSMAFILPPVFFGISAFLVAMVMGRIIALERSEIGLLKALGYTDVEICVHYLLLAGLIAVAGILIGWAAGTWLARALAELYAGYFDFPFLIFHVSLWVYGVSAVLALLTAALGASRSALRAARLAPAVAMQPPTPVRFRQTLIDRVMAAARLSQPTIMILRSLTRWPGRSALTSLGLALAVASVMTSSFMGDSLDEIIDLAFYQSNRQHAMLLFAEDAPLSVLQDVARLPAVRQVEGQQYHAAIMRNQHYEKRVSIEARLPAPDLSRVVIAGGAVLDAPPGGIVLSRRLATQMHVSPGDSLEVEFLSGRQGTYELTVSALVDQYFGLGAYMDLGYVNQLFRQSPRISVANVTLDDVQINDLHAAITDIPELTGTIMMTQTRRSFQDTIRQNVIVMNTIYMIIAVLITIGVAYNSARVQLSERARELASLRILGFTRGQVSYILVGETMLLALLAQPLGWALGRLFTGAMVNAFSSDLYALPLILKPATFSTASLVVLAAALGSVLLVRRRLDTMDLVAVMKTRE